MRPSRHIASRISAVAFTVALHAAAAAQQKPADPAQPPLLSTTPTPTAERPEPSQMSGLPLQVGDLPPGTIAVRVVRRSFAENIANQPVELQILGANGRTLQSTTDAAGRALFSGLKIGDTVTAHTTVNGERLETQQFELPAQGGVRVALVAGIGAGKPSAMAPPAGSVAASAPAVAPAPPGMAEPDAARWWVASGVLAVLGIGVWIAGWRSYQRSRRAPASSEAPTGDRRERLFQSLVQLEESHAAGRVADREYQMRRTDLIDQIIAIDSMRP